MTLCVQGEQRGTRNSHWLEHTSTTGANMFGCPQTKACVGTRDLALRTCPPTVAAQNREIQWAHQESPPHLVVHKQLGLTPPNNGFGFDQSGQSGKLQNHGSTPASSHGFLMICAWRASSSPMIVSTARTLSGLEITVTSWR